MAERWNPHPDEVNASQLNNFPDRLPGRFDRERMREDPDCLQKYKVILTGDFGCGGEPLGHTLSLKTRRKMLLQHHSRLYLNQTPVEFHETIDRILAEVMQPMKNLIGPPLTLDHLIEQNKKLRCGEFLQAFNHIVLETYRQLRALGFAHFDLTR